MVLSALYATIKINTRLLRSGTTQLCRSAVYSFYTHSDGNHIAVFRFFPYSSAMIKSIKFTSISVRNQDAALDFYTKKLGFIVLTDQPFTDQQRWIEIG